MATSIVKVLMMFTLCMTSFFLSALAQSPRDDAGGLSMDQLLVEAENVSADNPIMHSENSQFVKVELDILMSVDEYREMEAARTAAEEEEASGRSRRRKRTVAMKVHKWTDNEVFYQILPHFNGGEIGEILDAVDVWKQYTCLSFRQYNLATNRIQFQNGRGCFSRIGMSGGPQTLSLGSGCRRKIIIIHEIGHALGLYHEQSRPDRDNYITIIERNVQSRFLSNFDKQYWSWVENFGIPYDFKSIMHYGKTSFTKTGQMTIRTNDPAYQEVIGKAKTLSFGDIKTVNKMYDCHRHTAGCTKTDADCPGVGFVGKDCTCWCPNSDELNPIKPCSPRPNPVTSRPPTTPSGPVNPGTTFVPFGCQDGHRRCSEWAGQGECEVNHRWMNRFCKKSCRRCGELEDTCLDQHFSCAKWKGMGWCTTGRYMTDTRRSCPRSCDICTPHPTPYPCVDKNDSCDRWARTQECTKNPRWMMKNCIKSCNNCVASSCEDRSRSCSYWTSIGKCASNPEFMTVMCKQSCNRCTSS